MEFFNLVPPALAISKYLEVWKSGETEIVRKRAILPVAQAGGRVLADDVLAPHDLPLFAKSTVDGFAVAARDTFGASESAPALFTVTGEVPIGVTPDVSVRPGEAVRIATGAMMPPGADSAVMVEYTEELGAGILAVNKDVAPGENVIARGEDLKDGELVLRRGHNLRAQDIGVLSAIGVTQIAVYERPVVAVVSTGNEIVAPEDTPSIGQVRDTNGPAIAAAIEAVGCRATYAGIVKDELFPLQSALRRALQDADALILSGGSSVGPHDLAPSAISSLGAPGVVIHGLAIKPGKPTILALADGKPVFGLPGHPASALVVFQVVIEPLLRVLKGEGKPAEPPYLMAILDRNLPSTPGREDFVRVRLERRGPGGMLHAVPVLGKSGLVSTLVKADGLVRIPLESGGFEAGETIPVWPFTM